MIRFFIIFFFATFIFSCFDRGRGVRIEQRVLRDTTLKFKTLGQNIELSFDSIGNVAYLSSKSGTNSQNIFINANGALVQVQNLRADKVENILDFDENGQVEEIMWWNLGTDPATNQCIRFCKSPTRSPIIDQNNSSVPMVGGFYRQLRVGAVEKIKLG